MSRLKFYPYLFVCFVLSQAWTSLYSQTPSPTPSPSPDLPSVESTEKKVPEAVKGLRDLAPSERRELVHIGDIIDVDVVGSTEYDWRGGLNPEGFLDGPAAIEEPVLGLCRSVDDIAADIARSYSKLLKNPEVKVRIIDSSGRANVLLYGAVRKPQRFLLKRPVYLNELLVLSGGIVEKASGDVEIVRSRVLSCEERPAGDESGSRTINLSLGDLLKGKKEANPPILEGDTITVGEAQPIYVIGGVANPKRINSRAEMTVSRAIASAGGVTRFANPKSLTIFRREGRETKVIQLDFQKIQAKEAEDILLKPYDVLEVGQTGRSGSRFPPVIKVVEDPEKQSGVLPLRIID